MPVKRARLELVPEPRVYRRGSVTVTVIRKPADPARRRQLVRLLAMLLDKPSNPDEKGQP